MADTARGPDGKKQPPCRHPPNRHKPPYARRPGPAPGHTTRRAKPRTDHHQPIRVIVPDEPPALTPAAARALLRILLDARAGDHQRKEPR